MIRAVHVAISSKHRYNDLAATTKESETMIRTRQTLLSALLIGTTLLGGATAQATQVTFDFGILGPDGHANPTPGGLVFFAPNDTALTYTQHGPGTVSASITASGFNATNDPWQLTQRGFASEGLAEQGLGLQSFPDTTPTKREIGPKDVVVLDFSDVIAKGGSVVSLFFGSIQRYNNPISCEGAEMFASNTAPTGFANALGGSFVAQTGTANSCGPLSTTISAGAFSHDKYFSVTALQRDNPNGTPVHSPDNDITIGTVVVDLPDVRVPEPASLAMLAFGLIGFAATRRRT